MTILEAHNLAKHYDSDPVLEDISFKISKGEKVGLIGANGGGKSTLLKIIAGLEAPSAGTLVRVKDAQVGYLAQALEYGAEHTVLQEVSTVFAQVDALAVRLDKLAAQMAGGETNALEQYGRLSAQFEQLGGYDCQHRCAAIIDGLGLNALQDRPVAALSGGEKNLVALAKILLQEPDILLLDEPANHLDFAGLEWLENFIKNYRRTVVLVSHNRYLLDRAVERIFAIEEGHLAQYTGNYSAYSATRMKDLLVQRAWHESQAKEIQRLETMIERFKLWGQHRAAQSRQKALDRMVRIDQAKLERPGIEPRFGVARSGGRIALEIQGYSKAYGDQVLFDQVDLRLEAGERVALIGPNGSGKTSLFKDIVGQAAPDHGTIRLGHHTHLGYYAQEHEAMTPENSAIDEVRSLGSIGHDQAYDLLSRFLFAPDEMGRKIKYLSGGEKSRVQLAKLMLSQANLLLLDEPTNHLDIQSRERVEEALDEFAGTILIISHDRYFLDRLVTRVVEVDQQGLQEYPGDFSHFWRAKKAASGPPVQRQRKQRPDRHKKAMPQARNASQVAAIEDKIQQLETEKLQTEKQVAEAFNKRNFKSGDRLSRRLRGIDKEIARLYAAWEKM
ncbi:MAG: ATP-binding cassette domain-containing protein [Candidatus Latescibacteria bacterium]|nr:ATP-binding cassette domain-containing protein [Candidatus Latescibacterota bacterium]